jgi:hypothetical protein
LALAAAWLLATACAHVPDLPDNSAALADIAQGRSGDEVTVRGTVARVLATSFGRDGEHERFIISIAGDAHRASVLVAHNVGIAPFAPVRRGDDVIVRGELAIDATGPVIHWTHHDPRYRHPTGFVELHGTFYE